jgi:hypothetical protein
MSQRFGMADGRCFTVNTASGLLNNYIMEQNNIPVADNYAYRRLLQSKGPEVFEQVLRSQKQSDCAACDVPLLKVPNTY